MIWSVRNSRDSYRVVCRFLGCPNVKADRCTDFLSASVVIFPLIYSPDLSSDPFEDRYPWRGYGCTSFRLEPLLFLCDSLRKLAAMSEISIDSVLVFRSQKKSNDVKIGEDMGPTKTGVCSKDSSRSTWFTRSSIGHRSDYKSRWRFLGWRKSYTKLEKNLKYLETKIPLFVVSDTWPSPESAGEEIEMWFYCSASLIL